jgi:hypothetical protein
MWHSCRRHTIDEHFAGRDPRLRRLFQRYRALVREVGPITVYAQKTRIVFQARARFTGVVVRSNWLDAAVWLKRRLEHPRFRRIESVTARDHVHYFRILDARDLDEDVRAWVREAYAVGCQEAL